MNPHPPPFDDPQPPGERLDVQGANERFKSGLEISRRRSFRQPDDRDAGIVGRWKDQGIGEIDVERDQRPSFATADLDEVPVVGCRQLLCCHSAGIVARGIEQLLPPHAEVFVEFEFHDVSRGMST